MFRPLKALGLAASKTTLLFRVGIGLAIIGLGSVVIMAFYTHIVIKRLEAVGGTIRLRDFNLITGPVEVCFGTTPEERISGDISEVRDVLRQLRKFPYCRELRLHNLSTSETDLKLILSDFRPERLSVNNVHFSDESIDLLLHQGVIKHVGIAFCPVTMKGIKRLLTSNTIERVSLDVPAISRDEMIKLRGEFGDRVL